MKRYAIEITTGDGKTFLIGNLGISATFETREAADAFALACYPNLAKGSPVKPSFGGSYAIVGVVAA